MTFKTFFFCLAMLAGMAHSASGASLDLQKQHSLEAASKEAQDLCYTLIYRDTNAYAQCVRKLRDEKKAKPLEALGVTYFGFVGALSYMRVSQEGTDQIAYEFLQSALGMQKKLGIGDEALCSTVPGNCPVRMAQGRQLMANPPQKIPMRMQCVAGVCRLVPAADAGAP